MNLTSLQRWTNNTTHYFNPCMYSCMYSLYAIKHTCMLDGWMWCTYKSNNNTIKKKELEKWQLNWITHHVHLKDSKIAKTFVMHAYMHAQFCSSSSIGVLYKMKLKHMHAIVQESRQASIHWTRHHRLFLHWRRLQAVSPFIPFHACIYIQHYTLEQLATNCNTRRT